MNSHEHMISVKTFQVIQVVQTVENKMYCCLYNKYSNVNIVLRIKAGLVILSDVQLTELAQKKAILVWLPRKSVFQ